MTLRVDSVHGSTQKVWISLTGSLAMEEQQASLQAQALTTPDTVQEVIFYNSYSCCAIPI